LIFVTVKVSMVSVALLGSHLITFVNIYMLQVDTPGRIYLETCAILVDRLVRKWYSTP
jgi:hypothetical protein